jgi:hypothetical protein
LARASASSELRAGADHEGADVVGGGAATADVFSEPNLPAKMNSLVFQERQDLQMMSDEAPETKASTYLESLKSVNYFIDDEARNQPQASISWDDKSLSSSETLPKETLPLTDLLQSLHSLLTELGSDTRFDTQVGEGKSWRRITSPDVEIQVRTPDTTEARLRLYRMAKQIGRLLAQEE